MRNSALAAVVLAAATLLVIFRPVAAEPEGSSPILVCDLKRVIDDCQERRGLLAKLAEEAAKKRKDLEERVAQLNEQKAELQSGTDLSERDPEWYEKYEKAVRTAMQLKLDGELAEQKFADTMARKLNQLIIGARQVATEIMSERGADLVVMSKMGPFRLENEKQLQDEILTRRVLCSKRSVDITEEVLKRMDAWYKEHRREGGEVPERTAEDGVDKPAPKDKAKAAPAKAKD